MNTSIYKFENTDTDLDPFIERVETHIMSCLEKHPMERQSSILGEMKSQSV